MIPHGLTQNFNAVSGRRERQRLKRFIKAEKHSVAQQVWPYTLIGTPLAGLYKAHPFKLYIVQIASDQNISTQCVHSAEPVLVLSIRPEV